MRSRYTAYVRAAIDYLIETHDPSTRGEVDRAEVARWSRETEWRGLEIVETVRGGADDADGIVEFVARGGSHGAPFEHRERSEFRRCDGRWFLRGRQAGARRGGPRRGAGRPQRSMPVRQRHEVQALSRRLTALSLVLVVQRPLLRLAECTAGVAIAGSAGAGSAGAAGVVDDGRAGVLQAIAAVHCSA
jgi:uncharacterized protein YchJ